MKVIFLSIGGFSSIMAHDQYPDLMREFQNHGYDVYIVCSNEKRSGLSTELVEENGAKILRVQIGNITQSKMIEKGLATMMVSNQYKKAISKYFRNIKFDLILYTTPPITLYSVVEFLKKRDNAFTYLILKDIFPQNAVDLGILKTDGIKKIVYRYFRKKESRLYKVSDKIGTMSQANSKYIVKHNPDVDEKKIEICPNCIEPRPVEVSEEIKCQMRIKYDIPLEKKIFVYGGNLGKPQDIPFVIQCIRKCEIIKEAFFWIIGNGTEYELLDKFVREEKPENLKLSRRLPKEDYDILIASCDVGLVFLDHRFTIPNYPSRILSYMQAGLPVLSCTDKNSDIGETIVSNGFGWHCESDSADKFMRLVKKIVAVNTSYQSAVARRKLNDYSALNAFKIIDNSIKGRV